MGTKVWENLEAKNCFYQKRRFFEEENLVRVDDFREILQGFLQTFDVRH